MTVYTLWGQGLTGGLQSDASAYTLGVEFQVTTAGTLTAVWFYSASGAVLLPSTIALYGVAGPTLIHSESASWSGAAGSGWVRAPFTSPPALSTGTRYKAVVFSAAGSNWYSAIGHYWDTGAGQNGISNGPLSAYSASGSTNGQDSFHNAGTLSYPDSAFNNTNYLVDPELTVAAAQPSGLLMGSFP